MKISLYIPQNSVTSVEMKLTLSEFLVTRMPQNGVKSLNLSKLSSIRLNIWRQSNTAFFRLKVAPDYRSYQSKNASDWIFKCTVFIFSLKLLTWTRISCGILATGRILVGYRTLWCNLFCGVRKQHAKLAVRHMSVAMTTTTSSIFFLLSLVHSSHYLSTGKASQQTHLTHLSQMDFVYQSELKY